MRILEANVSYPINGRGGLYVWIEGSSDEVYKGEASRLAVHTANRMGWKGNGEATVGIPVSKGIDLYTRAYWFHERQ